VVAGPAGGDAHPRCFLFVSRAFPSSASITHPHHAGTYKHCSIATTLHDGGVSLHLKAREAAERSVRLPGNTKIKLNHGSILLKGVPKAQVPIF
jgi:hypothetical protein